MGEILKIAFLAHEFPTRTFAIWRAVARISTQVSSGDLEPNPNQNGRRSEWLRSSTFKDETKTVRAEFCSYWS